METKSVMKEIAELYGLSISEPFCIKGLFYENSREHIVFRFMEDGLDEKVDDHWEMVTNEMILYLIVTGVYEVVNNESWCPDNEEVYYIPCLSSASLVQEERWLNRKCDRINYNNGLVCKHVGKAREKAKLMLDALKKKGY